MGLYSIGRILYAIPFGIFGILHLLMADNMAGMVPGFIPGGVIWVYLTGIALLAACVAIAANKHARLASLCLAGLLASFILTIHLPGMMGEGMQMSMAALLKDIGLLAGALMIAGHSSHHHCCNDSKNEE